MRDYKVEEIWLFINTATHATKTILHQQWIPRNNQHMLVSNYQAYQQSSCKNLGAFRFNQSYKLSLLLLNSKQFENRVTAF